MMNLRVPLPEIKHVTFNIYDEIRFPEGYIEEKVKKELIESVSDLISIEYTDTQNPSVSEVVGSLVVMSVEEHKSLMTYIQYLQRENESLYKIIELRGDI